MYDNDVLLEIQSLSTTAIAFLFNMLGTYDDLDVFRDAFADHAIDNAGLYPTWQDAFYGFLTSELANKPLNRRLEAILSY